MPFNKYASEIVKRKLFDFEDFLFEKIYRLELSGVILNKDLISDNLISLSHATAYHAVWCRNLRELFEEAKKTGYVFENFIDIGSGKGKACFYAHTTGQFNSIIGIEFSEPLVKIANQNIEKFKSKNISFINTDANFFNLPNQQNLIFLFNPFDNVILENFMSINKNHFSKYNSIIAYANDVHRQSLTNFGFETIFRNQTRRISLYQMI